MPPSCPSSPTSPSGRRPSFMTGDDEIDNSTLKLQIQQFLDEWYYRVIHSLAKDAPWDRAKATASALHIFELQGVEFAPGEMEYLAGLEESALIPVLVRKLPQEFKDSFEHFVLQLQLIVTTATTIRKTITDADDKTISQTMEHADKMGLNTQILKQAIVQAGYEVAELRNRHTSWVENSNDRMSRLVKAADNAHVMQQELRTIQAQLGEFKTNQNQKGKDVLMRIASGNESALKASIFGTWNGWTIKMKSEKAIRDKFEKEIEMAETKLMEYRQAALNNVRNVLMRKAAENDDNLLTQVWKAWSDEVQETKREAGSQAEMKAMEQKLASQSAAQAENSKKVMARMSAGSDNALLTIVIGAWVQWLEEYKKDKATEDAVKAQEQAIAAHLAKKKDEAKGVLDRMNAATDSGLTEHCMSSWCQNYKDKKEAEKMDELMMGHSDRFASMNGRQKDNAKGVMGRVNEQLDLNLMLRCFSYWSTDAKLERVMNHYNSKMEGKQKQLQSVQHLFRSFANQLDQGLSQTEGAADSSRRRKSGEDGPVMLPDIHAKTR